MSTISTPNFAPDGLSGGMSGYTGMPRASASGQSMAAAMKGSTVAQDYHSHNEADYDDGLVHGHSWAVSSPKD